MRVALVLLIAAAMLPAWACGDGDASSDGAVTIEPLTSASASPFPTGGKPAAPAATDTPAPVPTDTPPPPPEDPPEQAAPAPSATPAPPTATATPQGPPASGRWIDVDVTNYAVRLMDGPATLQTIAPVGVGVQIDTGAYLSTQTGLFYVHSKDERLVYDAPFDTYISHWVGFDSAKDNGFHSLLKDATGTVVDASTGRVSNGCIRVGEVEAVFAFAEVGMPVWVHW